MTFVAEIVPPGQHPQREAVQHVLLGETDGAENLMRNRRTLGCGLCGANLGGAASRNTASSNASACAMASAAEPARGKRGGDLAGEPRQVLLHGLKLADRPLERDALVGVGDAERQHRFQRARGLDAADG